MTTHDSDKRLRQDSIEQVKKTDASVGMIVSIVILLAAIILGLYLFYRPTPVVTPENTVSTTTNVPQNAPSNNPPSTTTSTSTPTTTP